LRLYCPLYVGLVCTTRSHSLHCLVFKVPGSCRHRQATAFTLYYTTRTTVNRPSLGFFGCRYIRVCRRPCRSHRTRTYSITAYKPRQHGRFSLSGLLLATANVLQYTVLWWPGQHGRATLVGSGTSP